MTELNVTHGVVVVLVAVALLAVGVESLWLVSCLANRRRPPGR